MRRRACSQPPSAPASPERSRNCRVRAHLAEAANAAERGAALAEADGHGSEARRIRRFARPPADVRAPLRRRGAILNAGRGQRQRILQVIARSAWRLGATAQDRGLRGAIQRSNL
jgi:hypothetical protein